MYAAADVIRGIKQPYRIKRELNKQIRCNLRPKRYNKSGIDIFEEDWDNLIILDACRYDIFNKYADLPGELEYKESRASSTPEFIEGNFVNETRHDTVYVTGNSWLFKKNADKNVYLAYDVVQHPEEDNSTDKPTLITECAKEAAKNHPNKRLIVHYIRPHHPFLGPTAKDMFSGRGTDEQPSNFYNQVGSETIDITDEKLKKLYRENLNVVLPHVEELLEDLNGKTVVSADHGELLGDRIGPIPMKGYGHPEGIYVEELTKVPWNVYTNGERRTITEDTPISNPDRSYSMSERSVDERLRDLGYKV